MARPSYAAELDQYINEQLAQAAQQQSQAYAQDAQEQARTREANRKEAPPEAPTAGAPYSQDDEETLPYSPPRSPMPAAPPQQEPPRPGAAAPGGYGGGLAAPSPAPTGAPIRSHGAVAAPMAPPAQRAPTLNAAALDDEITRLQQMRVWLSDPLMCAIIDKFIGQRLGAAERRQVYYSVAAGVVSLIIGWLLSAISPASVLVGLFHH